MFSIQNLFKSEYCRPARSGRPKSGLESHPETEKQLLSENHKKVRYQWCLGRRTGFSISGQQ